MAQKGKEAQTEAVKNAFRVLLYDGIPGFHDGAPMMATRDKSFDYRFFDNQYIRYLTAEPVKVSEEKVQGQRRVIMLVSINTDGIAKAIKSAGAQLSPVWRGKVDQTAMTSQAPVAAVKPSIVVIPYMSDHGADFSDMAEYVGAEPSVRAAINAVASRFASKGYVTKDFVTMLQTSETSSLTSVGTQTDIVTEVVRQLPGDIIVTVDSRISSDGDYSRCELDLNAVERQTGDRLAAQGFNSGRYKLKDTSRLAAHAVEMMQDDFFSQIDRAFKKRIDEGLTMVVEFQLSESVNDWNFDDPIPSTGEDFKVWLSDWMYSNSQDRAYDRSAATDKFILATIKVPLWDTDTNRPLGPDVFASKLRRAVSKALGDEYGVKATELGQRLLITIN